VTALRTVLGTTLAILLSAATLGTEDGLRGSSFEERLLIAAIVGGPGFLVGGLSLTLLVDVQEAASTCPGVIRLTALLLGIAFGAMNILLATFVAGLLLGPFGLLATPLLVPGAALAGGVGLGLGSQIGIGRGATE